MFLCDWGMLLQRAEFYTNEYDLGFIERKKPKVYSRKFNFGHFCNKFDPFFLLLLLLSITHFFVCINLIWQILLKLVRFFKFQSIYFRARQLRVSLSKIVILCSHIILTRRTREGLEKAFSSNKLSLCIIWSFPDYIYAFLFRI